jgi:uncharacterized membrane protein
MAESRSERRAEARKPRLDQPRDDRRVTLRPTYDADAFGRASERIARFLGTANYLVIQTVIVIIWILFNSISGFLYFHNHRHGLPPFDKYPFILLNLAFSTQAAYAAPLILLAQNRQDDRDRVQVDEDRSRSSRTIEDTEFLARELASVRIALGEVVTRDFLRSELRSILEELDTEGGPKKARKKKRKVETPEYVGEPGALLGEPVPPPPGFLEEPAPPPAE